MFRWVVLALLIGLCSADPVVQKKKKVVKAKSQSRGWGKNMTWVADYEEGLLNMVVSKKPLMVIIHREDCPYSKALKKAFVADKSIQEMAKLNFVMLNLVVEPEDKNMSPDGLYVPRILFVDPSMTVRINLVGKYDNRLYAYEPADMELLAENMKKATVLLHTEL